MASTKVIGDLGEQLAAEYLQQKGYRIIERNGEYGGAEVDILMEAYVDEYGDPIKLSLPDRYRLKRGMSPKTSAEHVVVFCEVKTRFDDAYGSGLEAVTPYKAGRYVQAAKSYMSSKGLANENVRFDIVEVANGKVRHFVNAFTANDAKYPNRSRRF